MKRILITAGGTAISWHICQICNLYFRDKIEVFICDINKPFLVPASTIAKDTFEVPFASDNSYLENIDSIVKKNNIDIIIPLIPNELVKLSSDSDFISSTGLKTAAVSKKTIINLSDKKLMCRTLIDQKISTPRIFSIEETEDDKEYFIKPRLGFGSLNTSVLSGKQIKANGISDDFVVQELCDCDEEVTVEVFNGDKLKVFARKRVATKSGVCVKMIPIDNSPFIPVVEKLVASMDMPIAFNLQFLYDNGIWKLFDCNLRLGAGTALTTAAGFQLTRAFIAELINEPVLDEWFDIDKSIKSVLRVYNEVAIK